jgi:hypothetical protein
MAKTKKQKIVNNLTKAERRAQHSKNLDTVTIYSLKRNGGKRLLSLSYPEVVSKGTIWRFIKGMGNVFAVSPPGRVQLPTRTVNERLRRSWYRTGMALHLAMDEYDCANQEEDMQHSETEFVHAAIK